MKRRTFCISAAVSVSAAALPFGRGFTAVSAVTADVTAVTGDGRKILLRAADVEDFRAGLRGQLLMPGVGGNFGIATSFEYRLHPFDGKAVGGHMVFPFEQARSAFRGFGELFDRAPDGLWIEPILATMPGGARGPVLDVCQTENLESADTLLAPYRKLGKPIKDEVGPMQYVRLQTQDDERARIGGRYYTKSGFVQGMNDDLIDTMLEIVRSAPVPRARVAMPPKGGAVDRIAPDATAFWHRSALYSVILQTAGDEPGEDAANVGWARSQWPALEKFTTGFYANTNLSEMPTARVGEAYGGNYRRLLTLKRKYDPTNLFRLNANIDPKANA